MHYNIISILVLTCSIGSQTNYSYSFGSNHLNSELTKEEQSKIYEIGEPAPPPHEGNEIALAKGYVQDEEDSGSTRVPVHYSSFGSSGEEKDEEMEDIIKKQNDFINKEKQRT